MEGVVMIFRKLPLAKGHWTGSIKEAFSAANIANLA